MTASGAFVVLLVISIGEARAVPPDHTLALLPIETSGGQVERMDISESGDIVVGRTRDSQKAWVLDVDRWTITPFSGPSSTDACAVTGAAAITLADGTHEIWLSCLEGKLVGKHWDGEVITNVVDDDDVPITFEAVDDQLNGVWWSPGDEKLYTIAQGDESLFTAAELHVVDPFDLRVDFAIYPAYPLLYGESEFNEGVILDDALIVSHIGSNMSSVQLGFGAEPVASIFTATMNCQDLATSPFGWVYCVDPDGQVAQFTPVTNVFAFLQLGTLLEPQAVVVTDDPLDGWIAVTGLQVKVWEMLADGTVPSTIPYFESEETTDSQIYDMVTRDGYVYGGGVAGNLHIVGARPWIEQEDLAVVPTSGKTGDVIELSFAIDEDADWEVFRGGDRFGEDGVSLATGSSDADEVVTISITLDDTWDEGANPIYIIAENELDLTGHGRIDITVDNPPLPPVLTAASVSFADEGLVLAFASIDDEDLDHYEVFVSETPFVAADWPIGGPVFDGNTDLATPVTLVSEPDVSVTHVIKPLENYVTYYIGVHAWDAGGKEGPMSNVVSGMPLPTSSAAELAGETGGGPCNTGGMGPAVGTLPLLAWLLRRRQRLGAVAVVAVAVGLGAFATPAHAQQKPFWERQDTTRANGDFEFRYGVIDLADDNIQAVYNEKPTNLLQIEAGPQIHRYVEFDVGFGFFQELSHTVSPTGAASGEVTMLTWWPLAFDGTLRGAFWDEQPVVPFIRYGWDYIIYSEKTDNGSGGKDLIRGSKFGTHWAAGGNLLLDMIGPRRASLLEAQSGINDSWITVEYRHQVVDNRSAPWNRPTNDPHLTFTGNALLVGVKLDY
jgi:hypothetical protein